MFWLGLVLGLLLAYLLYSPVRKLCIKLAERRFNKKSKRGLNK